MNKRTISLAVAGGLGLALISGGAGYAIAGADDGSWGPRHAAGPWAPGPSGSGPEHRMDDEGRRDGDCAEPHRWERGDGDGDGDGDGEQHRFGTRHMEGQPDASREAPRGSRGDMMPGR